MASLVLVLVGPTVLVFVADLADVPTSAGVRAQVQLATLSAVTQLEQASGTEAQRSVVLALSRSQRAWVRLSHADGTMIAEEDSRKYRSMYNRVVSWMFVDEERPLVSLLMDEEEGSTRDSLRPVREENGPGECVRKADGYLLVCTFAKVVVIDGQSCSLMVQRVVRRPIRSLYDVRFHLLRLTLVILPIGLLLGWWLGTRIVWPLESLRRQVTDRAKGVRLTDPLVVDRVDEIGDLAESFNELIDDLSGQNKAYESFVADVAHEMKNPVAAIRMVAEAMDGSTGVDGDRAQRYGRVLSDSSRRLNELLTQFLELARAESGLMGEDRLDVCLGALTRGVLELVEADERFIDIRFERSLQSVPVRGVPVRLASVARNLLENAASFAGEKGWVRIEVRAEDTWAVLTVEDSGPGIREADLDRVFDRFFSRRTDGMGTGLGLALVSAVVEAHGGRVSAVSPEGKGACLEVRIPIHVG